MPTECPRCTVCEGEDHHWLEEVDDDHPEGIMACKHCPATRPITDEDVEINEWDDDEREVDDPNQCPDCGDNLDEFDLCVSCDY
jgi:hypothetical protein